MQVAWTNPFAFAVALRQRANRGGREFGAKGRLDFGLKGASGMGGAEGTGVLRCTQDDRKGKQQQEHATARINNGKNTQPQEQTTAKTNNGKD
jgi:hypothetical protein